jgi:DNA-binding NtrC family response regulator
MVENTTETIRLLVVSREPAILRPLRSIPESDSWQIETAASAWDVIEHVQSGMTPHLLVLDLPRGDSDSLHVLRWLRRLRPNLPVIVTCFPEDTNKQKEATLLGAQEALIRPITQVELGAAIRRHLPLPGNGGSDIASEDIEQLGPDTFFVSASPITQKLRAQAELLAEVDVPVLILGEMGSGKETLARLIHHLSVRSGFKFLKINCADRPADLLEKEIFGSEAAGSHCFPGKLEAAEKGTILFEEFTEMPNHLQRRLSDVLQDHCNEPSGGNGRSLRADVRVLASTSADIERAMAEGKLRQDLCYRLSAFTVHVPPLRQRREEVRVLLHHFMHCLAKHYGLSEREFSTSVIESCERYWWPGNVCELESFVKRYLVAGDSDIVLHGLDPRHHRSMVSDGAFSDLQDGDRHPMGFGEGDPRSLKSLIHDIKSETERNAISLALEKTGWNRKAAARLLKVSYRTLLYKIEQYHLRSTESFSSPPLLNGVGTRSRAS